MITVRPNNLSIQTIKAITVTKPPGAGAYWHGVSHKEAIDLLIAQVKAKGWHLTRKTATVSPDKADLIIDLEIEIAGLELANGNALALALLTSNAQRRGTRMMVGVNVAPTKKDPQGYGIVLNEVSRKAKKHTTPEFESTIKVLLNHFRQKLDLVPYMIERLDRRELTPQEAHQLLTAAGDSKILAWSRIGKIFETILNQPLPPFTSMNLYEAFCKVVRLSPPMHQLDQMNSFRKTLPLY